MKLQTISSSLDRPVNLFRATATCNCFYVFLSAAKAALLPFLTLFFRLIGLSALETGIIMAAKTLTGFFWAPLWARCATAYNKRRVVLIFSLCMMGVMYMSFIAVYYKVGNQKSCEASLDGDKDGNSSELLSGPSTTFSIGSTHKNLTNPPANIMKTTTTSSPKHASESVKPPETTNIPSLTSDSKGDQTENVQGRPTVPSSSNESNSTGSRTNKNEGESSVISTTNAPLPAPPADGQMTLDDLKELNILLKEKTGYTFKDVLNYGFSAHTLYGLAKANSPDLPITEDQIQELMDMARSQEESSQADGAHRRFVRTLNVTMLNNFKASVSQFATMLEEKKMLLFIVVLLVIIFGEFFSSPVEKIADDAWFDFLERIDDMERYGRQRYWGSLAFALVPILVTCLVDYTPCHMFLSLHHFLLHFHIFGIFIIFTIFVAFYFPMPPPSKQKYVSKLKKAVHAICCDVRGFLFVVTLLVAGMVFASFSNFLFWHLQDLGASEITMGLCVSIGAFAETPMLVFSNKLVRKLGNGGVVSLCLLILAARVLYYGFLWTPWAVLPAELTNAFTHTLLWYAILSYDEFNIGSAVDRSIRSILSSIYFGIGFSAGAFVSGLVYGVYGASVLFWSASILSGGWCLLFSVIQVCLPKKERVKYIKLLKKDDEESSDADDDWLEMTLKEQ